MAELSTIDLLGFWLGIFLTFCILSFLYKDNPFYKLAEHLFIGVSIGYIVTKQYYNTLKPKLIDNLGAIEVTPDINDKVFYLVGLALAVLLLLKLFRKTAHLGRYPIAFVVGFYAGLQINGVAQGDLGKQLEKAMESVEVKEVDLNSAPKTALGGLPGISPLVAEEIVKRREQRPFESVDELTGLAGLTDAQKGDIEEARGSIAGLDAQATVRPPFYVDVERTGFEDARFNLPPDTEMFVFGTISKILLLLGLLAGLIYFYFSIEQKGAVGRVSRFGIWVLMIGFGASFGYTVQGRISLAIGRVLDITGASKDPHIAEQVNGVAVAFASIFIIIVGLVVWELKQRKPNEPGPSDDDDDDSPGPAPDASPGASEEEE